jgi:hypothetical protein
MTLLLFAAIVVLMLIAENLLFAPLHLLNAFHLPTWVSMIAAIAVLSWLIGE